VPKGLGSRLRCNLSPLGIPSSPVLARLPLKFLQCGGISKLLNYWREEFSSRVLETVG
jgi:hypothetical protein